MKIFPLLVFALFLFREHVGAQAFSYDTASIDPLLKKNTSQVVRMENTEFSIFDLDHARLSVHRVETILNERGKSALYFVKQTDKFISLDDVEIRVYDATGKSTGKYKQRDLYVVAGGEGLVDDYKTYYFSIPVSGYPVTIDCSYKMSFKGSLFYPPYEILVPGEAVENSSFKVWVQNGLDLRYEKRNTTLEPAISTEGNYKLYTWTAKNISPIAYEEGAVSYESRYPSIRFAPNKFQLDGYVGDMGSWKSFGKWYYTLCQGANQLSDERKSFYAGLVKAAKTDQEKIRILYEYLQKNFRYVSISLGIGGFKPYPADFTDNRKYGDCKALSNYLQAVLQSVGIKSYQALVNASYNKLPVDPEFPCNQFNHVILCVPEGRDSIWLECTSKTNDFGNLGSFTENRNALLITEDGGVLVPTPRSRALGNTVNAYTNIALEADGSGKTNTVLSATGEYKHDMIRLMEEKTEDQKSYLINKLGFKEPSEIRLRSERETRVDLSLDQELETMPELNTGHKMILSPFIFNLWSQKLPKSENRQQDFYFDCPFEKTDTTVVQIPDGFKVDGIPESKNNRCEYASYATRYWYDDQKRRFYASKKIQLDQYRIPASGYRKIKDFFDAILVDNQQRLVIIKTDNP